MRKRSETLASLAFLAAVTAAVTAPLVACLTSCFVDFEALRGELGKLEVADPRLNAWILAWVHHSLLSDPSALFDANIFHPAPNALAGSEHLLGVAALLLPFQAFGPGAVALHQLATLLSFWLGGVTTWAAVRGLGGSAFAALAAGTAAVLMPWRVGEASHVQLLSAQWFPLVWLLAARVVWGDRRARTLALLSGLLALQVLSSFYLAYFLLFSCALLVGVLWLRAGFDRRALAALAAAGALPAALLLGAALPYLEWRAHSGFVPLATLFDSVRPGDAWSVIGPRLELGLRGQLPQRVNYEIPLVVSLLGVVALVAPSGGGAADRACERRRRGFALALWVVCAGAFVLALGRELAWGDTSVRLPSWWAAQLVPGFANLRNPLRWAIVIGLAFPILAGLGVARVERLVAERARLGGRGVALLRALLAALLLLSLPTAQLPAAPAWEEAAGPAPAYRALAALPPGPVVEIPWPLQEQRDIDLASRYMLASTLHWKPITNGTSGYAPRTYRLLRQVAQGLPRPEALALLGDLAGVRWLVVHDDRLLPHQREPWSRAAAAGVLRRVFAGDAVRIFEVPDWERGGRWRDALVSAEPRPLTFAGLPRTPLALPADAGSLSARVGGRFQFRGGRRIPQLVALRIDNRSATPWPGLDVDPEGLVRLRYAFRARDGAFELVDTSPLAADVPASTSVTVHVPVTPPARGGAYELVLELVQEVEGTLHPLPVAPARLDVEVVQAARHAED